ncbi:MAG: hypothetical protein IBJ16_12570 [Chitinophagaceae bacterium]|nr:hypothetical protein [Chitinophagaceae bacterium]
MSKAKIIGTLISISVMSAILGAISGVVWALALTCSIKSGLFYGSVTGVIVGLFFFLIQKLATSSGNLQNREATFTSGSMMTIIFILSIVIAIIVGVIRWF